MSSVTNNTTKVRIGYRMYSLWRLQLQMVTITETAIALAASRISLMELHCTDVSMRTHWWRLNSETDWRGLTSETDWRRLLSSGSGDWLTLIPETNWRRLTLKADGRGLTLCIVFRSLTHPATMETLALLLLVNMQCNNTRVVSISMELLLLRLPSNDGLQSNTSHCSLLKAIRPEWPNGV
jgi:hypothetical protein